MPIFCNNVKRLIWKFDTCKKKSENFCPRVYIVLVAVWHARGIVSTQSIVFFCRHLVHNNNKESIMYPHCWHLVMGIHRSPVDCSHQVAVMNKAFKCHDVIMFLLIELIFFSWVETETPWPAINAGETGLASSVVWSVVSAGNCRNNIVIFTLSHSVHLPKPHITLSSVRLKSVYHDGVMFHTSQPASYQRK